jgi:hypothetical protein
MGEVTTLRVFVRAMKNRAGMPLRQTASSFIFTRWPVKR